jgi:GxxExxY protein
MEPDQNDLSGRIIGAAIKVHETLGPGFLEAIYEEALCIELKCQGMSYERQLPVKLTYRDQAIGEHRLDLLVEGKVVVELKTVVAFDPIHFAIARSYLKATGQELALLLNFSTPTLSIKRVGREWHSRSH